MSVFKPFVAPGSKVREFTLRAIVVGCILGVIFGVGNAYLGLKIGMTLSPSIPAAVLSIGIMRAFFKKTTILENNLVQTIASVGGALTSGVIFTVPALFLLEAPPSLFRMFILSFLGGILGILFMIPMRRYLIVEEHGKLPYPEGTACAHILTSSEEKGAKARLAIMGIIIGSFYAICTGIFRLWNALLTWKLPKIFRTELSIEATPALLGVGYIIGPRISTILFAGGLMAWWVIIPLIAQFGTGGAIIYPGTIPISQMTPQEIWSSYVRYIGAGAVGIGGLLSMIRILPLIYKTIKMGVFELFKGVHHRKHLPRTDQDISLRWLILGSSAIILLLWLFPGLPMNLLTIVLLVILGFLFVAVTSITVGLIGSTSNPVSGMTIATLLVTCLIFVTLGWTERLYLIAAITMAIVANVAICLAGATSQDLKTGFIVGATPKAQQIGEMIGILIPALLIGGIVYFLNKAYVFGSTAMPAPQGTLMALIAKGIIEGNIPLTFVLIGVILGLIVELLSLPVLPFAIGLYLPFSLSTCTMVGGLAALYVEKKKGKEAYNQGVLAASGLVAGDACMGVVIALLTVVGLLAPDAPSLFPQYIGTFAFLLLALGLVWASRKKPV